MTTLLVLCCFSLPLAGVFGADTVSVMEGDSVTLPNHFKMNKGDELEWMFERATIAGTIQSKVTDKFSGRLEFNNQTGSLTIRNIRTNESGLYTLQFRPAQEVKTRTFRVTVIEGVYTVSVVKGNPFSLTTDVHQQHDDVIEWRFNGKILPDLTGHELNITNARTDQSGEYKVKIYGTHRILQKTFRVEINVPVCPPRWGFCPVRGSLLSHSAASRGCGWSRLPSLLYPGWVELSSPFPASVERRTREQPTCHPVSGHRFP